MNLPISFYGLERFYQEHKEIILNLTDRAYAKGYFLDSDEVKQFEQELAQYIGRKYAIAVSSCTDALFFSLKALGIKKGDEVIVPAFSFIASLSPILHCEAIPVFVDIHPNNLSLFVEEIEQKITSKTRAIVVVQLFGSVNQFDSLEAISKKHHIPIIEDAAQALGAAYQQRKAGTLGELSCFSFDPSKIVQAFGTGGAILTDDEWLYQQIKRMHYHGKEKNNFVEAGYNSRISSSQAALLRWQMAQIDKIIEKRTQIAHLYQEKLSEVSSITLPQYPLSVVSNYHKFAIFAERRNELKKYLTEKGIQTNIHYDRLLFEYELIKDKPYKAENIKHAHLIKQKELTLPLYPQLTNEEIHYICQTIKSFYV
ncbi:MAG: DegT/DnrJ/EryC1/StrS family aminotransferase [Bacteroidales bacterium]|nr:DegT/DnrJ/EryC1/StrS family aminotransferase [Bacteroidales bacterium]